VWLWSVSFHIPSSKSSLGTTIKPKIKYKYHAHALLFYIVQKKSPNRSCIFFKALLPYIVNYHKVSLPPHKFVGPPCGTVFIPNFVIIHCFKNWKGAHTEHSDLQCSEMTSIYTMHNEKTRRPLFAFLLKLNLASQHSFHKKV